MAGRIHRHKKESGYTNLDNYASNDKRLSWKAKGLHTFMMTRPDDWQFNISDLANRSTDKRDSTASAMKELIQFGYVVREKIASDKGLFEGYDYHSFERPENAISENGSTVNGLSVNGQTATTNNYKKKRLNKVKTDGNNIFPDAEKAPVNPPPKLPPWTKTIAALFDKVNEEESAALGVEFTNFNWGAGAGRQFKALKDTRKAMIPDIRAKLKHEPTEQEIESGFDYLFRYGFRYLAGIAENKGGTFSFTPAIILNNYNNILQYAKQNHNPTTKQDRANAKRDEAYEELFRMGLAMDV